MGGARMGWIYYATRLRPTASDVEEIDAYCTTWTIVWDYRPDSGGGCLVSRFRWGSQSRQLLDG
jgi:hypothetical protein